MNIESKRGRRKFLRSLFSSSAAVVVAPAIALEVLNREGWKRSKSFFYGVDVGVGEDQTVGWTATYQRIFSGWEWVVDDVAVERIKAGGWETNRDAPSTYENLQTFS